jgi:hypothetical protein
MTSKSLCLSALRLVLLASLLLAFCWADAKPAIVCKDCPFPFRVSSDRWMMPNQKIEIQIREEELDSRMVMVHVWLRDAKTGMTVATGSVRRPRYYKSMHLQLLDRSGGKVRAEIHYIDLDNSVIQVKFTCEDMCSIGDLLD